MGKRYVLFRSDKDLDPVDLDALAGFVRGFDPKSKVIEVEGEARSVIVKTDSRVAPSLRAPAEITLARGRLVSVLTSGAIGKLKSRSRAA